MQKAGLGSGLRLRLGEAAQKPGCARCPDKNEGIFSSGRDFFLARPREKVLMAQTVECGIEQKN
jgi:hypothetical protein